MNNEFWMPVPSSGPYGGADDAELRLTPAERAVLRRLRRGETAAKAVKRASGLRHRAALRRRRRALDRLSAADVHSLVRIVMELGL